MCEPLVGECVYRRAFEVEMERAGGPSGSYLS